MPPSIPWVPADAWHARTRADRASPLDDPVWRIANLYEIRTDDGVKMPFIPSREQQVIIWDIHVRGLRNLIVPKARRIGMSTVLGIIAADMIAFEAGVEVALVDKTRENAEEKLARIVKFAVDSLAPELRGGLESPRGLNNQSTLGLRSTGGGEDLVSTFRAGVSFRGAGPHFLWISEWGTIQFENQARSEEIKTGAMEAARRGIRVIETTWKGGQGGHVWDYITLALETAEEEKTAHDWRLRFFPWWVDQRNVREGSAARIDTETNRYLDEKQAELGITFTPAQRLWYYHAKRENGIFIKRENPTTLEECWSAPVEGAIYADLIERLRAGRGILPLQPDPHTEVDTFWDLGSPQNTVVWYVQRLGEGRYDIIDCDGGLDLTTEERVEHMRRKGHSYGSHYVPHDAAAHQRGGLSFQEELLRAGLEHVRVVPRTPDMELGINAVRRLLPRARFNSRTCARGIQALAAYHAKIEPGQMHRSEQIVHDWASHYADALRVIAEADAAGMLSGQGGRRFDVQGMKAMNDKAALAAGSATPGVILVMERGVLFQSAPAESAWLLLLERPQVKRFHLIAYAALAGRHVWCVLRPEFNEHDLEPASVKVVAASLGEEPLDPDLAAERIAATSQYYGHCLVVTIADDPEGICRALNDAGQERVLKRPRSTLGKSAHQIGWTATEDLSEPIAALAKCVREEQLECYPAPARQQIATHMRSPDGRATPMPGYRDDWVRALAIGIHCLPMATPFHPGEIRRAMQEGAGMEMAGMFNSAPGKRSSL